MQTVMKWTTDTTCQTYQDALMIRKNVFVHEQNVPLSIEIDSFENACLHGVYYIDDQPVGTVRLQSKKHVGKVQRVAVLKQYRKQKIGELLMYAVEQQAKQLRLTHLTLGAQMHAISFYEKLGYIVMSTPYEEANIMHCQMEKRL